MNPSGSLNRILVDEALDEEGTHLLAFVQDGRDEGKSMEEVWMDLRQVTGVPFSVRSLYRWVNELERQAS